ncbi:hypothetical protein GGF32_007146 [Allomyces javanicus]|nr:hypothetical protein GGF32_007146 [Allomyces javanicus]
MMDEPDAFARQTSAVQTSAPEPEPAPAPRILPTLDQLPYHVLYRLAECMSQPWLPARVDMLHLALAAPTLYEPCIAAAIRTGTGMNSPTYRLRLVYPDRVDLTEHEIGHLVTVTDVVTDRLQSYLILPPRNHQGRLTFDMIGKNPSLALPPHCNYMYLYHAAPWRDPQFQFPRSLAMLHLRNIVPEGVDASQVLSTLPRHLVRLTLSYSKPDQFATVIPQLLPHFFELRLLSADMRRIGLFGPAFPMVTRDLSIDVTDWGPNILRTLPLAPTLRRLKVHFSEKANAESIAPVLLPRLPASLKRLDFSDSRLGGTAFVPALAQHLPPQLSDLLLANYDISAEDVAQFAGRWPPTLRRLDVSGCRLSRTDEVINLLPTGLCELHV